uniref:PUM-HD domain-containing protein n=1 Tax=Leersia perrieri TaxID=77586 RepID=A0A0D9WF06_9ORYZ
MAGQDEGQPEIGRMDTFSDLGFVGSDIDDKDSGKEISDNHASQGVAIAVDTPATTFLQQVANPTAGAGNGEVGDVQGEHTSTPDENVPIEVADMQFSWDIHIHPKAEIQGACEILKDPSYRDAFFLGYGSCDSDQMIGVGDSQYKLARPSSPEKVYADNSDATGSNTVKFHQQISTDGNIKSRSELSRDAIGGLLGEGNPLAKSGKQVEQRMVKSLSAHSYNPVYPVSQGVSSCTSSSQHIVGSSGAAKYTRNSGQEMQVACGIARQPSNIALYGNKNPDELIGLSDPRDKFIAPSSFQGVNISSISNTSSGMNLPINSAQEKTEYNQLKLKKQIGGYQRFEIGSTLNMDGVGGLTEVPENVWVGQNMVNTLSAEQYQPVLNVSHGTSASLSLQHPNETNQLVEHREYHPRIHCTQLSLQPTIKDVSTSLTLRINDPCYQENFCLADNSLSAPGISDIGDGNQGMSFLRGTAISTRDAAENQFLTMTDTVHSYVSEIYSTSGHQNSADSIQIQHVRQAAWQPTQQSLHTEVAETYSPFGHQFPVNIIQRQFAPLVTTQASHSSLHGSNNCNMPTGFCDDSQKELFRSSSSHRNSTDVISRELPMINLHGETMMGKADFKWQNLQRQVGHHESTVSRYFGTYPELPRTSSFPAQKGSDFSQLNSVAMRYLPCSERSSTTVEKEAEQSAMMGPALPFVTVSGGVSPLPGSPVSSVSRGSSLGSNPNNQQGIGFSTTYRPGYNTNWTLSLRMKAHAIDALSKATRQSRQEYFDPAERNSQCAKKIDLNESRNSNMSIAQQHLQRYLYRHLQRNHKKVVATTSYAVQGNFETSNMRDQAKEFLKIVRDHEACFLSFYHPGPIPSHIMNMLNRCFNVVKEREMLSPKCYARHGHCTPRLAHQDGISGLERSYMDYTHTYDSKRLDKKELNALLVQRKFNILSKGNYQLFHIEGHVFQCSIDQCGSRFIQHKLPTATPKEKFMVYKENLPRAIELMIEEVALFQKREIIACFLGSVLSISCQMYGCRVIQKAVEFADLDQKIQITRELNNDIMKCIHDQNANHVVQKCIEHVPQQFIQFFLEGIYGHVVELSVHPYGCRVIQRILEYFNDPLIHEIFLKEIIEDVYYMAQDPFANYVVQHILQHGNPLARSAIVEKFHGNIITMCKQKHSSNVIEKCLVFGSYDEKQKIIDEILSSCSGLITSGETEALMVMVKDQYANFVVQKVIETCDEWQRKLIIDCLRMHHRQVGNNTYAKHVMGRLERLIEAGRRIQNEHAAQAVPSTWKGI